MPDGDRTQQKSVAQQLAARFGVPKPPTVLADFGGGARIAITRLTKLDPKPGLSVKSEPEESFTFVMPLRSYRFAHFSIDGRPKVCEPQIGQAFLLDMTSRIVTDLQTVHDGVRFHMPWTTMDHLAFAQGMRRIEGLRCRTFGTSDPVLFHLSMAMLPVLERAWNAERTFVEQIAIAFHDHVIRTYGGATVRGGRRSKRLWANEIRRVYDLMENRLCDDPSISELGAECGMSPDHFARSFQDSVGYTPHQWILKRKIDRAKLLLASSNEGLANIAYGCGFADQSHFGRVFAKQVGLSPAKWRRTRLS
jgi:AraC family transcriptional regulator